MKRRIGLLCGVALACAGLLAGCGTRPAEEQGTQSGMTETVTVSTISIPSVASGASKPIVETTSEALTQGEVNVSYPNLVGLKPPADGANELVQQDVEAFAKHHLQDQNGKPLEWTGDMTSTVIPHKNTVSIVTAGVLAKPDKTTQTMVYTTNLSLVTGKRISTGVRENAAKAAQLILNGEAKLLMTEVEAYQIDEYFQWMGEEALTALLKRCDFTSKDDAPDCFSYFMDEDTDDIGIYLPVGDELGDYAIFLLDAQQLDNA